mgnify:CR=1 FL=1
MHVNGDTKLSGDCTVTGHLHVEKSIAAVNGKTRVIDELPIAAGYDPDTVTDWYTYFQAIGNNSTDRVWILPARTYNVSQSVIFKYKGTKLMGEHSGIRPRIVITPTNSLLTTNNVTSVIKCGFWFANKSRIRGLDIEFKPSTNSSYNHRTMALLNFQKAYTGTLVINGSNENQGSEADMDSSVDDCALIGEADFNVPGSGAINYLGRNMRVTDCTFTGSGGNQVAINLSYAVISYNSNGEENDSPGQQARTAGFRKCIIRDNTFHLRKNAVCINVYCATGSPTTNNNLYGLLVASNMNDVGGTLLKTNSGVRLNGLTVTGNSNFRSKEPYIYISPGSRCFDMVINGNTFGGAATSFDPVTGNANDDNYADGIYSGGITHRPVITGNNFYRPKNACINLPNNPNKALIVGNAFAKADRNNVPALIVSGTGLVMGNVSSCDTFISGTTTNWTSTSNI